MIEEPMRKGLGRKRNPEGYRTTRDIIIPAGTLMREASEKRGGAGYVEVPIGHGKDFTSHWVVQVHADAVASGDFQKVGI